MLCLHLRRRRMLRIELRLLRVALLLRVLLGINELLMLLLQKLRLHVRRGHGIAARLQLRQRHSLLLLRVEDRPGGVAKAGTSASCPAYACRSGASQRDGGRGARDGGNGEAYVQSLAEAGAQA